MKRIILSSRSKQRLIRKGYQVEETKKSISIIKSNGEMLLKIYEDQETGFIVIRGPGGKPISGLNEKVCIWVNRKNTQIHVCTKVHTDWICGF